MTEELLNKTIDVLKTLKQDAKWALKGKWAVDYHVDESMKGFGAQMELIDTVLPQLKALQR